MITFKTESRQPQTILENQLFNVLYETSKLGQHICASYRNMRTLKCETCNQLNQT